MVNEHEKACLADRQPAGRNRLDPEECHGLTGIDENLVFNYDVREGKNKDITDIHFFRSYQTMNRI